MRLVQVLCDSNIPQGYSLEGIHAAARSTVYTFRRPCTSHFDDGRSGQSNSSSNHGTYKGSFLVVLGCVRVTFMSKSILMKLEMNIDPLAGGLSVVEYYTHM